MAGNTGRRRSAIVIALVTVTGTALAAERTWTDATGKLNVTAEFAAVQGDKIVLHRTDGDQRKVPLERFSDKDRTFLEARRADGPEIDAEAAAEDIAKATKKFFSDLRSSDREIARRLLTKKAQSFIKGKNSPLAHLPKPASGTRSIRTGKVQLDGAVAEIRVGVRAAGKFHKTKLHFRYESEEWRIFAISATYADGEKSINFEAEGVTQENADPLQALLGKPLKLTGYTIGGRPLDMANYQGKVVLVDFWATWCGPCLAEMSNIWQNFKKYLDDGFEVIAISVDRDMKALRAFVAQQSPPWTIVVDNRPGNKKTMGAKYGIRGIPAFILLGKDGKVAAVNCRGRQMGHELARLIGDRVSSSDANHLR